MKDQERDGGDAWRGLQWGELTQIARTEENRNCACVWPML